MKPTPIFNAKVHDGRLTLPEGQKQTFKTWLRKLEGKTVQVTVQEPPVKRTLDQNAYWWAIPVRLMAAHCGYTDSQMHYVLLGECFGYVVGPTGKDMPNVASSSKLTVEEFTRLIDWVIPWAAMEFGVEIPLPNEVMAA